MSTCERYRDALLEAGPDELRGEGRSDLAAHVRACPSCARAAELILEATDRLHIHLAQRGGAPDVDAILRRAGVGELTETTARPPAPSQWTRARLWVPLAAAAAVTALVLVPRSAPPPAAISAAFEAPPPPTVEAAPGHNVAVLQTDNPDITVLWFF